MSGDNVPSNAKCVSVVLPTNRIDGWLRDALRSVLDDASALMEVIVVLDGIEAKDACAEFSDHRVRVISVRHGAGLANALNVGVQKARAPYVARMDGDDLSLPGRFEAQARYLDSHQEAALVGTQARRIDSGGRERGLLSVPYRSRDLRLELLTKNVCIHPSIMFRRQAVEACGGYDVRCQRAEDYELYLRLALDWQIANLADVYLLYREHEAQMSRTDRALAYHTLKIVVGRHHLARRMGVSLLGQIGRDVAWFGAQVLRNVGLR